MSINAEDRCAFEMIRLGYAFDDDTDQRRCLTFRVVVSGLEAAQYACCLIDDYNEFTGTRVAAALGTVPLRYGSYYIGREGSPVIYIRCQADEATRLKAALLEAAADECDYEHGMLRAWWD